MKASPALVSTAWLSSNLPSVRVVDASWYLPSMKRDAKADFAQRRIPGAVFFDIDATDDTSGLPHMLPSNGYFGKTMTELGAANDDHIVCYDASEKGLFSAARLWWMLRAFGHANASVLDGGFAAWQREDRPVEEGAPTPPQPAANTFKASLDASLVADLAMMRALVDAALGTEVQPDGAASITPAVVDARSQARFEGSVAEARPGCRSGRMPGSRNLPFDQVLSDDGTMKSVGELNAVFAAAGVGDIHGPLVGSCGSGVTASVLALALAHAGRADLMQIYDGSWAEYGTDEAQPLATGPAKG